MSPDPLMNSFDDSEPHPKDSYNKSNNGIVITRLPIERWRDLKSLRLEALEQDELAFGSSSEEEARFDCNTWKERIPNAILALDGETLIGMVSVSVQQRVKRGHVAGIYGMYVKPSYRGRGIGTMLLESALDFISKKQGVVKAELSVSATQTPAFNMYKKMGFETAGRYRRAFKIRDSYYDEILMEKFL